eukprot:scaffold425_cov175-Amphora_coffeaeformis.AAC.86
MASNYLRLLSLVSVLILGLTPTSFAFQPSQHWNRHPRSRLQNPSLPFAQTGSSKTQLDVWSQALAVIDTFYHTAPYAAGALTCGAKASAADFVAQRRQRTFSKFDRARNVAFLLYGAVYQGVAQEYIYNHCYASWFGSSNHPIVVLKKVLFDLCVQTTLVTLPVAYLTKAIIFRYPLRQGLRKYKHDVVNNGLLKKYFALWGPVQCLTFGVVPEHLRISFIAAVSFFWLIILSTISGRVQQVAPSTQEEVTVTTTQDIRALVNATAAA